MIGEAGLVNGRNPARRLLHIALLTIALTVLAVGLLITIWWGLTRLPTWFSWKCALVLLLSFEFAYGATLLLVLLSLPVMSVLSIRGRSRRATWRSATTRGALLCTAILIGFVAAEMGSAIWQMHAHRHTVVPIGGLRRSAEIEHSTVPLLTAADLAYPRISQAT
jgi:hypothetical protein